MQLHGRRWQDEQVLASENRHLTCIIQELNFRIGLGCCKKLNFAQLKADEAIAIWPEKLAAYRNEEAIASDPEKKFQLKHLIHECQQKIKELGG